MAATLSLGAADESQTIFRKLLPDGRAIRIEKSVRVERHSRNETNPPALPTNMNYVVTALKAEVSNYTMYVRDEHGAEAIAWEKEQSLVPIPSAGFSDALKVFDVAAKGDQIAILYSTREVTVDIAKKMEGGYTVVAAHPVFSNSSFKVLNTGQLAWMTDLYAVLETTSEKRQTELYRVTSNSLLKVFPQCEGVGQ